MGLLPKYCGQCGVSVPKGAYFCGECGEPVAGLSASERTKPQLNRADPSIPVQGVKKRATSQPLAGDKNKKTATLLGIFLGGLGAHKFYMGSWGWGIAYLLTFWIGFPFVVSTIEWVRYVLMTDEEFNRKAEAFKNKGPFGFFW